MPNREAPSRIVPRVFAEDGGGYSRPALCCLCGQVIRKRDLCYSGLPSDPPCMNRPLHVRCQREFDLFVRALGL
jgi:hypothetical protein